MRLIDADDLKEQLKQRYFAACDWKNKTAYKEKADGAISAFLEAVRTLNKAPTIDAKPIKHAEWKEDGCLYKCTNCGHTEEYYDMSYCPCCGAKMEKEKTDGQEQLAQDMP